MQRIIDYARGGPNVGRLLYGVFGCPIGHSLSPVMHNAAFIACGINALYLPFDVRPADLGAAVAAVKALGMGGVNVTVPHKRAVVPFLDELCGEAAISGSVNTVVHRGGRLVGYSTDGEGFVRALREEAGFQPSGSRVCILGTGGAALAVAVRLLREGAAGIAVVTRGDGKDPGWPAGAATGSVRVMNYAELDADPSTLADCDLLINATPVGMSPHEDEMPPIPGGVFRPGMVVYDLVYRPARTVLMRVAEDRGARVFGGLGMLVHQGAAAFELWTGRPAPVGEMRAAVVAALQ